MAPTGSLASFATDCLKMTQEGISAKLLNQSILLETEPRVELDGREGEGGAASPGLCRELVKIERDVRFRVVVLPPVSSTNSNNSGYAMFSDR